VHFQCTTKPNSHKTKFSQKDYIKNTSHALNLYLIKKEVVTLEEKEIHLVKRVSKELGLTYKELEE